MQFGAGAKSDFVGPHDDPRRRAVSQLLGEYQRARDERNSSSVRMAGFAETITLLLQDMPADDRAIYERRLAELRDGGDLQRRGGEIFGRVINLFKTDRQKTAWTILEIQSALGTATDPTQQKAVHNAIGYLAKSGRLRRVARGQYVVTDIGVGLEYDGSDDGTLRRSENDD
jgi:hypothetical protein